MPNIERWRMMWQELGASTCNEPLFNELIACYSEPHRKYHTTQHLDECFLKLQEMQQSIQTSIAHVYEVELALWFHDAVYDPKAQDNEEKSAAWACAACLSSGLPAALAERVYALISATQHNRTPIDPDGKTLVDIDLSIFGATTERFDEYEYQVREEYAWVPKLLFQKQRRKILQEFIERPRIYYTDFCFNRYEALARANLQRSIQKLDELTIKSFC